jgi:hypothetical protein
MKENNETLYEELYQELEIQGVEDVPGIGSKDERLLPEGVLCYRKTKLDENELEKLSSANNRDKELLNLADLLKAVQQEDKKVLILEANEEAGTSTGEKATLYALNERGELVPQETYFLKKGDDRAIQLSKETLEVLSKIVTKIVSDASKTPRMAKVKTRAKVTKAKKSRPAVSKAATEAE